MSYKEAVEDGIPFTEGTGGHFTEYYPPCQYCGRPTRAWTYRRDLKYACPECRKEAVAQSREEANESNVSQKQKKLNNAIKRISAMTDISKYDSAIAYVSKNLNRPRWFQSTEEIMVALELIKCGVRANHQVKIFEYYVDYVLPDLRVVLEVDGPIYHGKDKTRQQQSRDDIIRWKLGSDWEIIRISTDCINMNITRLMPAIKEVLRRRKKCAH